jgi:UDP-glucose:glycoprotein glucosyltransferase
VKRALLEIALASRVYSPAVAIHAQLAPHLPEPCGVPFAVVHGSLYCTPQGASTALEVHAATAAGSIECPQIINDVDHVRGNNSKAEPVFLYAHVGTRAFVEFHTVLSKAADEGKIRYVLRNAWGDGNGIVGSRPGNSALRLQGYGVEFALKSVEYKVVDEPAETKAKKEADEQERKPKESEAASGKPQDDFASLEWSDLFDRLGAA